MRKLFVFFFFSLYCINTWCQGEIDTQEKILFQNEQSFSLLLNSNGFGAGFFYGKRLTYLKKRTYDIEFVFIKDPKEVKVSSDNSYFAASRKFVYGKMNTFMNLRPSIGFQREIFSKEDRGSIAIKYYYSAGPSIGITKPIYYSFNVVDTIIGDLIYLHEEKEKFEYNYNPHVQIYGIGGHAGFWKGIDELKLHLGLHAKAGFTFEYSTNNRIINALDVGMVFDVFAKKIPIMYNELNRQYFLTLFVAYRFGWITDAKYKPAKITKEGKVQSD